MRLRHLRQTPELAHKEGSFSYQGVSKEGGGLGTRQNRFFFFLRIDSRELPQFALRIAGPSK